MTRKCWAVCLETLSHHMFVAPLTTVSHWLYSAPLSCLVSPDCTGNAMVALAIDAY